MVVKVTVVSVKGEDPYLVGCKEKTFKYPSVKYRMVSLVFFLERELETDRKNGFLSCRTERTGDCIYPFINLHVPMLIMD